MKAAQPNNYTRKLHEDDITETLLVADCKIPDGRNFMFTVWYPTPNELKALSEGGHIVLGVQGREHPAVVLYAANGKGEYVPEGGLC